MLARLNRELGADFALDQFRHHAFYNPVFARIEMHLVSLAEQVVAGAARDSLRPRREHLDRASVQVHSAEFATLAAAAGSARRRVWTDDRGLFSVQYLERMQV